MVIAVLIKITSKGPVIYCQRRIGQILPERTDFFVMYKFRTMTHCAESSTGAVWAVENDPRLTILGKVLRKSRLDELPQLINVLRGDMSLIGPRPERPEIALKLEKQIPYYLERTYGVLPGITGLAQVYQGYDASIEDVKSKILYDFAYSMSLTKVARWLKMDCIIIFRTVWIMILGRGR
jgi:lipopolysaccharide/colanic/teichoic acid biosynthesis glycosyltransferase